MTLKNDLPAQNWEIVYWKNDVDSAYNTFLRIFTSVYDKNCPNMQQCCKQNHKGQPWFTKGLKNACKKTLYREYIKQRTEEAENKYKNKLTNIIRVCRKKQYQK